MNEVSRLMGKCSAAVGSAANSVKTAAANSRQDGKIAEAEKTIARLTKEIGNLTVLMLDSGKNVGPDIKERYAAIQEARDVIVAAQAERISSSTVCPVCGRKTAAGMRYCGHCGALIAPEALEA